MQIDILTLFPKMFKGPFDESLIEKARSRGILKINIHDLRKWSKDKHKMVDDKLYGGGNGMVLKVDIVDRALSNLKSKVKSQKSKVVLLTPQGKKFSQKIAKRLSKLNYLILICGHYEGFDERIREHLIDEEISIGDFVLTGGELPAMVVADAVARLIPGVVGKKESTKHESFSNNLLDFPVYTRPESYKGWKVPKILLSGDHKKIEGWRKKEALKRTKKRRPDLLS